MVCFEPTAEIVELFSPTQDPQQKMGIGAQNKHRSGDGRVVRLQAHVARGQVYRCQAVRVPLLEEKQKEKCAAR